ncbi:MAG: hypothetical protein OEY95_03235 [Candidatus Bathyarchaeota archaeon]|nr:hypothetical protein [Candidatus Bathyarchaeota archaeon]
MEIIVLGTLVVSTFATSLACFAGNARQTIRFLSVQAAAIGFVELMYCLINLLVGLHLEALIDFFATFAEWFSCAVVIPLIIYWGMVKTENMIDKPVINIRKATILVVAIAVLYMILWIGPLFSLPVKLDVLPFSMLMFSLSVFLMITRRDPLKILVGLNMAENALYPLFAESPISLVSVMLALMVFVNIVGVFVIVEAYREYGTLSITEWRRTR